MEVYVTIKLNVNTDIEDICEVIDELSNNSDYSFASTENIKIVSTEWVDASLG